MEQPEVAPAADRRSWMKPWSPSDNRRAVVVPSEYFAHLRRGSLMRLFPGHEIIVPREQVVGSYVRIVMLWQPSCWEAQVWLDGLAERLAPGCYLDWLI